MRDTLLELIEDLAARWGRDLETPAHRAQVVSWLDDFGEVGDPVLRRAFAELRRNCERWPTYAELRDAIAQQHRRVLCTGVRAAPRGEPDCTIVAGALWEAARFVVRALREGMTQEHVEGEVEKILRGEA